MSYGFICAAFMCVIVVWKADFRYKEVDNGQCDCVVFGINSKTVFIFKRNKMSLK